MECIFIVILGVVIGSFLNVCIYRIPQEQSIAYPPSHCSSCNHKLKILDLIPICSYIFLKGKCRYCSEKISLQYPLIELFNGILYFVIYIKYGFSIITLKYCMLASLLVVISIIDYRTQFVYTSTIIFGYAIGVAFIIVQAFTNISASFELMLGGLLGCFIILLIVYLTNGMGEGDIEIATLCGLFLGVKGVLLGLFIAIIIGGIIGIIILTLKIKGAKERMAFGPFIAIGTIISMLFCKEILTAYINLFV